ncbi:MAG: hypothetical protein GY810_00490 [Aureispira sp.]|nr:hypothetical protein [Aureispira sp.]
MKNFIQNLIFSVLLLIGLAACNSEDNSNTEPATVDSTKAEITIKTPTPVEKEIEVDEGNVIRASSYSFTGNIGEGAAVEMRLDVDSYEGNCISVKGEYWYLSSKKPMQLEGEICFEEQTVVLKRMKEGKVRETFEGVFTTQLEKIIGTWEKMGKEEVLEFELTNGLNAKGLKLFAFALEEGLTGEVSAESPSAMNIGLDKKGVYIEGLSGPHVKSDFGAEYFSSNCWYENDARNSDSGINISLVKLKSTGQAIAISYIWTSDEEFDGGKDAEEPNVEETKSSSTHVWLLISGEPVDILVEDASAAKNSIYAILKDNKVEVIDKDKGTKEVFDLK